MKTLNRLALLLLACASAALPQMVTVTAHTTDSSGNPLNGTIYFAPTGADGTPISYRLIGAGQVILQPVSAPVSNGVFSLQVADTTQTQPTNVCYLVWATNTLKQTVLGGRTQASNEGYKCVQVSPTWCANGVCNFDAYQPNLASLPLIQTGAAPVHCYPARLSFKDSVKREWVRLDLSNSVSG